MNIVNVAELLKDCPKGMELDCLLFNNPVTLNNVADIDNECFPITVTSTDGYIEKFNKYGQYYFGSNDAKCIIFPKGKTTWEDFVPPYKFKDGDILATDAETKTLERLIKPKFDPKTLKPFDNVLCRDSIYVAWTCGIFSHANFELFHPFKVGGCLYKWCIPYNEDTKHLVGTTDEAPEYYRYWED